MSVRPPLIVEQVYFRQWTVVGNIGPSLELPDRVEGRLHSAGALLGLSEGILACLTGRNKEDRWPGNSITRQA